ncbi:sugar phosphate nucleotidyltransferase [Pseudotenacibaculum sp. MALMAid0570]|uniref:sugar phosphate nucleotidyltransferase n=1 Tax=Pseudotenacibaculum sp. MALMAid0570 TaxID=3143938 RepID=UPI0032DF0ED0
MSKLTLVILAAGMGSRYGGLKQLDEMSENGDTIIDFSIYDAIEAGFSKIVFVIRESFKEDFKSLFDKKLAGKVEVAYVCQELHNIPKEFLNSDRIKPWGTGHAMLMAKEEVNENFAVINADDYYGKEAYVKMADQLNATNASSKEYFMVGYQLKNTISKFGSVSRGQCYMNDNQFLEKIIERTHIEKNNGGLYYKDDTGNECLMDNDTVVSMNFWGFTTSIFQFLEREFTTFLKENSKELRSEFFIPLLVDTLIRNNEAKVQVLESNSKWLGVTYKEDKPHVVEEILKLKRQGVYPNQLW